MKKIIFILPLAVMFLALIVPMTPALAIDCPGGGSTAGGQPCQLPTNANLQPNVLLATIEEITDWMFTGLLVLAVVMLIIAAYHYLFSGGSEEGTQKGKNYIIYTVIAIAVAMLAKGITFIVYQILK